MHQPTPQQSQYLAWLLTRQARRGSIESLAGPLLDAQVDLNPHQVEAALFACKNPLERGVILADEVGLGKPSKPASSSCNTGQSANAAFLSSPLPICASSGIRKYKKNSAWIAPSSKTKTTPPCAKPAKTRLTRSAPSSVPTSSPKPKRPISNASPGNLSYLTKRTACATCTKTATSSPAPSKTPWRTCKAKCCSPRHRCKTACSNSTA